MYVHLFAYDIIVFGESLKRIGERSEYNIIVRTSYKTLRQKAKQELALDWVFEESGRIHILSLPPNKFGFSDASQGANASAKKPSKSRKKYESDNF